jgi:regulation of enolase protein 1 (concanavalin A-like superfamily)
VEWINEPAQWSWKGNDLSVATEAATDFWRVTAEGEIALRDNGHVFGERVSGDFDVTVDVSGDFATQYDQAGVMVRISDRQWFKTGVELLDGLPRFSTVVTFDFSNWMMTALPPTFGYLSIRLASRGNAVEVFRSLDGGPEEFCAHLYVPPAEERFVGAMCAAPKGDGFTAEFHNLVLAPRKSAS